MEDDGDENADVEQVDFWVGPQTLSHAGWLGRASREGYSTALSEIGLLVVTPTRASLCLLSLCRSR